MKKLFVVLSLVLGTSFVAFAQKPVSGAKGFSFGLNNIFSSNNGQGNNIVNTGAARTGTLLFRYYIADDMAARFAIGYSRTSTKTLDSTSQAGREIDTKNVNSTFSIQVGAQKMFGESEKLEPYVAADLYFAKSGGKYLQRNEVVNAALAGGANGDFTEVEAKAERAGGGYNGPSTSIGLVPAVGFNYFFSENFAIGAEFGWGIVRTVSDKNVEETTTTKAGATTTTTKNWFNTTQKETSFDTRGNGAITVSVFF